MKTILTKQQQINRILIKCITDAQLGGIMMRDIIHYQNTKPNGRNPLAGGGMYDHMPFKKLAAMLTKVMQLMNE